MPEIDLNRVSVADALSFAIGTGIAADAGRAFAQGFSEELESRPTAPSRDILAAMAMQGILASASHFWDEETRSMGIPFRTVVAVNAYELADAMLEQRSKKPGP